MSLDFQVDAVFDTAHFTQSFRANRRITEFNHKGGFPVGAIGNQRVIGFEFFFDSSHFKDLLDAQHFLDLVANSQRVFKVDTRVIAQRQLTIFLVCQNFGTELLALFGVLFQRPEIATS